MADIPKIQLVSCTVEYVSVCVNTRHCTNRDNQHVSHCADPRACSIIMHFRYRARRPYPRKLSPLYNDEKVGRLLLCICKLPTSSVSYTIFKLSNMLLICSSNVQFCGYSMPHPSEARINVRVQTRQGIAATDAFREGCNTLVKMTDVISAAFEDAIKRGPEAGAGSSSNSSAAGVSASSSSSSSSSSAEAETSGRRSRQSSTVDASAAAEAASASSEAPAPAAAGTERKSKAGKAKR